MQKHVFVLGRSLALAITFDQTPLFRRNTIYQCTFTRTLPSINQRHLTAHTRLKQHTHRKSHALLRFRYHSLVNGKQRWEGPIKRLEQPSKAGTVSWSNEGHGDAITCGAGCSAASVDVDVSCGRDLIMHHTAHILYV